LNDLPDWSRLDRAGFHVTMMRSVRRQGWLLAVIGVAIVVLGSIARIWPLMAIGVALAAAGAWNVCRPAVSGLAVDGVTLIVTGLVNCLTWLWVDHAEPTRFAKWILTGGIQVVWGVRRLGLYRMARRIPLDPPAMARLETIVRALASAGARDGPTIAEFRTGRFPKERTRIGLYAEGAIALIGPEAVRLEKRSDIWIEARGTTTLGRSVKVRVQMSDFELEGEMPTADFERFELWKLGQSPARSIAA